MRIFVTGATGAIGRRLIPLLVSSGHDVVAMTRVGQRVKDLWAAGAEAVVADGLDREAVVSAVSDAAPEVVVHEMTALAHATSLRRFDAAFELTNRLRTEGTDHLLAAARAAGARCLVAGSYAGWPYAPRGGPLKTEDDPLDDDPPRHMRRSLDAIRHLEEAVLGAGGLDGVVLRYGSFYGPGTSLAADGDLVRLVRHRRLPIVGGGAGVWSFVHIDDAAAATAAAIEGHAVGIYNVVDDEPAPVVEWLPELARLLGARIPLHIPTWLGRLATGDVGVSLMTRVRGATNAKAKRALGWQPHHPTWRDGFRAEAVSKPSRAGLAP